MEEIKVENIYPNGCKIEATLKILGNKWTFLIIKNLMGKKLRFNELLYLLKGISPKTLTTRLRDLEKEGVLTRKIYPEIPPRVEYSLTVKGDDLKLILDTLNQWGKKYI